MKGRVSGAVEAAKSSEDLTGMRMVVGHRVEDAFDQGEGGKTVISLNPPAPPERGEMERKNTRWSVVVRENIGLSGRSRWVPTWISAWGSCP